MASRQGGPGGDDATGARTTGSPDTPGFGAPELDRDTAETDAGGTHSTGTRSTGTRSTDASGRIPPSRESSRTTRTDRASTDPGRRTAEDPPLRDPGLYALTDHFYERLGQPGRYVTTRTVSNAIRRGQLRWNRTDGWRFALVEDGVRFIVVVSDTETDSPVVVTAWTELADREAATTSTRWDTTDVDTIDVRTALSVAPSSRIPDRIRPRRITRPFEVGSHRLRTETGEPFLRCVECNRRFRSKEELTTRHCHGRT